MKVLGLDLGTNSIGWAVVDIDNSNIEALGSRIIPMDAAMMGDFDKGNSVSQTKDRTKMRGIRRLLARQLLRRERLHRVLNKMGMLPEHYAKEIDFDKMNKRMGQFRPETEPKLAWCKTPDGSFEFIFKPSFQEMLSDFRTHCPALGDKLVPYDWTIYYLRQKALHAQITEQELSWILLNFNQKRGYYQLRGEDDDQEEKDKQPTSREYFDTQKIVAITDTGLWYKELKVLVVELENGNRGKIFKREIPQWVGLTKSIIASVKLDKEGKDKYDDDGMVSQTFKIPTEEEWDSRWALVKLKTENDLSRSGKTVGQYIYSALLDNPSQKIIGKLVRVIDRKFYKEELRQILQTQSQFHEKLRDRALLASCVDELYPNNKAHQNGLLSRGMSNFLLEDILFYQRPLKSKKSLIADCQYEVRHYTVNGEPQTAPLKCISTSHPLFEEYRLWQFVANLKIFTTTDGDNKILDVTQQLIGDQATIYEWLRDRKEVEQKQILSYLGIKKTADQKNYRWNYVDKAYPCCPTRAMMLYRFKKNDIPTDALADQKFEIALWHLLYSVNDPKEILRALATFARKQKIKLNAEHLVAAFGRSKPFPNDYGAYSEKAIKKLLPLMRQGKYWKEDTITAPVRERIDKIISGEVDANIDERTRAQCAKLTQIDHFQGLPVWMACYVVYGRHSETANGKWSSPNDIDKYLKAFKQHSLRNPVVEQVVMETLRTVRDIWKKFGTMDRIHVELGRDMKNTAAVRAKISKANTSNEDTNIRIKILLREFANSEYQIDGVRPYSPSQQDLLRIYEQTALGQPCSEQDELFIKSILKKFRETDTKKQPTRSEVLRYKLWLEQRYRSPYTGAVIPLGKLFSPYYQIEHIIPQSRYFDDSFNNKVICESEVNKLKDNALGFEFIKNHHGEKLTLADGRVVSVFEADAYEKFVADYYINEPRKKKNLLLTDIPDTFNQRQQNDSRYISKLINGLLSNIVREENETEATSKNVIVSSGGVTTILKQDWGINDVWNDIVYPRFERLNTIVGSQAFGGWRNKDGAQVFQTQVPIELSKGFNKKRIDHRHHAMDALVIACSTRSHVNYLNNENSKDNKDIRYDYKHKLCYKTKQDENGNYQWRFNKPWDSYTQDVRSALQSMVVGFKQKQRIINRTTNSTLHYDEQGKKVLQKQKGDAWAIRQPLHKDTVFGQVNLRLKKFVSLADAISRWQMIVDVAIRNEVKTLINEGVDAKKIAKTLKEKDVAKIEIYYFSDDTSAKFGATRKSIDSTFDAKKIACITDTSIQKIMLSHLEQNSGDPSLAFSADGLAKMNENIFELNGRKPHKPIFKVRWYETLGTKFPVGATGNKTTKFVEAQQGTNLFFAVYANAEGKRTYATIPLRIAIEQQKQGFRPAQDTIDGGESHLIFTLSPNDLIYVPTEDQIGLPLSVDEIDRERIYKVVNFSKKELFAIPHSVAQVICDKVEYTSQNKILMTQEREILIPLDVDRLGNIKIRKYNDTM
ncbi:MAG: HNH endonuclease domain-containing protein [Mucinivorans sp.]